MCVCIGCCRLVNFKTDVLVGCVDVFAVLLPHDPVVEEGSSLTLNCTLEPSYKGSFSYADIYFKHSTTVYSGSRYIQLVPPNTAKFTLKPVTVEHYGHFVCCLPDRPNGGGILARQNVVVVSECWFISFLMWHSNLVKFLTGCVDLELCSNTLTHL